MAREYKIYEVTAQDLKGWLAALGPEFRVVTMFSSVIVAGRSEKVKVLVERESL